MSSHDFLHLDLKCNASDPNLFSQAGKAGYVSCIEQGTSKLLYDGTLNNSSSGSSYDSSLSSNSVIVSPLETSRTSIATADEDSISQARYESKQYNREMESGFIRK